MPVGCTRPVERGEALYQDGRYVEAAETFELTENRLSQYSADTCAEFGLYRGLTFLRLDDLQSARQWLAYAYSIEQRTPGNLPSDKRQLLERGWAELERRTRSQTVAPPDAERIAVQDAKATTTGTVRQSASASGAAPVVTPQ
jgi:hypothetical protein